MNLKLMKAAVVLGVAVPLSPGLATLRLEARNGTLARSNLEELDAMFRKLSNWGRWALAKTSARENRWEFLLTTGPIPVTGGTGSPLNPIAVF